MNFMRFIMVGLIAVLGACDCNDGSADGDGGTTGTDGTFGIDGNVVDSLSSELCSGTCACADGLDNDGDGLIDGADPECTAPYDQDEGTFATGIPGDNRDPMWQDCFFDGNSGSGDDGCRYRTGCLTGDLPATDRDCMVTEECLRFCRPRTPNACDCFGCCDVTKDDGTTVSVQLNDACSLDNIDDESACPRCVQNEECVNECGTCEYCPGRDLEDLPPECYGGEDAGVPMYMCEDGPTCMTSADCASDPEGRNYCQSGCCIVYDLI